jgi:two-component system KDP operon response regulator KdpE
VSRPSVLLIDDDETLTTLLGDHLRSAGYGVAVANDGASGLCQAAGLGPDLIVLDVMMPGMDGWQVLERLGEHPKCPVIMLTAKDQEFDKLRAFRLGVDDYVTKPFSFAELMARVGAVLGRAARLSEVREKVVTGDVEIDLLRRRVRRAGETVELTPTEYRLLEVLARNLDVPVASEELVRRVWGPAYAGEVEHVKHYIWSLRRKLEADPGDPKHLITERGFGYRFV